MAERYYREESRRNYHTKDDKNFTPEELRTGSLLRIADAVEKMAVNYTALQNEVAYLKERKTSLEGQVNRLLRSNAALRGCLKRFKKKK